MNGRRKEHEALCVPLVRSRRAKERKPPAAWVMVAYWQDRRIAGHIKGLTQALASKAAEARNP